MASALTLDIPSSLVREKDGFSIDFGCSSIKIAYAVDCGETVLIHFICYSRERIDDAFQYIKDNALKYTSPEQMLNFTGVGCSQFTDRIHKELGVKFVLHFEGDCLASSFAFLAKNYPLRDVVFPPSEVLETFSLPAAKSLQVTLKSYASISAMRLNESLLKPLPKFEDLQVIPEKMEFPALVFLLGSDTKALLVNEDGTYEYIDLNPAHGRCMMGLGSMVAEAKTYSKLLRLAEKGQPNKLDQTTSTILADAGVDGVYSNHATIDSVPLVMMGQAVGKDRQDFRAEDRALAVVSHAAFNIAVFSQMWVMLFKAEHVYFIGGLSNSSQLLREEIGKYFAYRSLTSYNGVYTHHHFLKLGGYCGTLGALLKTLHYNGE